MNLYLWVVIGAFLFPTPIKGATVSQELPQVARLAPNPILEAIAVCESGNKPNAKSSISSASGRFQFLKGSWEYYGKKLWGENLKDKNIFDFEDSTELAHYVFSLNGVKDWLPSEKCWRPVLDG